MNPTLKLEPTDIDSYDWDWWEKYSDAVIVELTEAFSIALLSAEPTLAPVEAGRLAAQWAEHRAARLIRLDGDLNIVTQTRERVRTLVSDSIANGDSLQTLQKSLREDFGFSSTRAGRIARTETAEALGQGSKQAAIAQGRNEKGWFTQGGGDENEVCRRNEAQGWIKLGDPFQSGRDTIPQHPNCMCNVRYRTNFDDEERSYRTYVGKLLPIRKRPDLALPVEEIHCPVCGKRLPVNNLRGSATVYCKQCDKEYEV